MSLTALKFHFTTPLHIGTVREDYDKSESIIHSDTLYSAIIWAWNVLGLEEEIPQLVANGNFTISSLFPFHQMNDEAPIYFFPRPIGQKLKSDYDETIVNHKLIKEIKYLDAEIFKAFLSGRIIDFESYEELLEQKSVYLTNKKTEEGFDTTFIKKKVYPRVYVPRHGEDGDTQIYYIERLFFKEDSGLFCLAQFDNEDIKQKVIAALRFLGDEGLGTDKHVGNGLFKLEQEDFNEFDNSKIETDYAINLSLFCPENKEQMSEILDRNSTFGRIKRGGWITKDGFLTYRKKSISMFTEGSVFKTDSSVKGKTVNLKPEKTPKEVEHPIYRVGRSLFLPIKIQES